MAPPRRADPTLVDLGVDGAHFRGSALRVHLLSVNGAEVPPEALDRAFDTISRHVHLPVQIDDHGELFVPETEHDPFVWPGWDRVDAERVRAAAPEPYRPPNAADGVAGFLLIPTRGEVDAELIYPLIEPGVALVVCVPGTSRGLAGYTVRLPRTDGGFHPGLVVLRAARIERIGRLVGRNRMWEWTLTHEIGHVLGVPGDASHAWNRSQRGVHCTRPDCVMYSGADWRFLWTSLWHGLPLDFCPLCAGELAAASPGTPSSRSSPAPGQPLQREHARQRMTASASMKSPTMD